MTKIHKVKIKSLNRTLNLVCQKCQTSRTKGHNSCSLSDVLTIIKFEEDVLVLNTVAKFDKTRCSNIKSFDLMRTNVVGNVRMERILFNTLTITMAGA